MSGFLRSCFSSEITALIHGNPRLSSPIIHHPPWKGARGDELSWDNWKGPQNREWDEELTMRSLWLWDIWGRTGSTELEKQRGTRDDLVLRFSCHRRGNRSTDSSPEGPRGPCPFGGWAKNTVTPPLLLFPSHNAEYKEWEGKQSG